MDEDAALNWTDPPQIIWLVISYLPGGRSYVTDANLIMDTSYVNDPLPTESVPSEKVERILSWNTTHGFDLADIEMTQDMGHYLAPKGILLNQKYVDYLKQLQLDEQLHFRASGPYDPVLIYDGDAIIGAVMPMKLENLALLSQN